MPYSQGLSNNPYRETIQPKSCIGTTFFEIHSNIFLLSTPSIPTGLFPVSLSVKMLKRSYLFSILDACLARLNLLYLIILAILAER